MNFGFTKAASSSWNQPVCEEHFQTARGDETLEEIPKVEDLSIRGGGEGSLQELETVVRRSTSSRAEISGESSQKGGETSSRAREGKKKGAKSRREREGDNDEDEDEDNDEDDM